MAKNIWFWEFLQHFFVFESWTANVGMYVLHMLFDIAMKKYFPKMYPSGQIWDKKV